MRPLPVGIAGWVFLPISCNWITTDIVFQCWFSPVNSALPSAAVLYIMTNDTSANPTKSSVLWCAVSTTRSWGNLCATTPENFCRLFNHPSIAAKCTLSQNVLVWFYMKTPGILRKKKSSLMWVLETMKCVVALRCDLTAQLHLSTCREPPNDYCEPASIPWQGAKWCNF